MWTLQCDVELKRMSIRNSNDWEILNRNHETAEIRQINIQDSHIRIRRNDWTLSWMYQRTCRRKTSDWISAKIYQEIFEFVVCLDSWMNQHKPQAWCKWKHSTSDVLEIKNRTRLQAKRLLFEIMAWIYVVICSRRQFIFEYSNQWQQSKNSEIYIKLCDDENEKNVYTPHALIHTDNDVLTIVHIVMQEHCLISDDCDTQKTQNSSIWKKHTESSQEKFQRIKSQDCDEWQIAFSQSKRFTKSHIMFWKHSRKFANDIWLFQNQIWLRQMNTSMFLTKTLHIYKSQSLQRMMNLLQRMRKQQDRQTESKQLKNFESCDSMFKSDCRHTFHNILILRKSMR